MELNIITPDKSVYSGEATSVTVPGRAGSFEILKDHAPIISTLDDGKVIMKGDDTTTLASGVYRNRSVWDLHLLPVRTFTSCTLPACVYLARSNTILVSGPSKLPKDFILNARAGLFILDLNHAPWGCGEPNDTNLMLSSC